MRRVSTLLLPLLLGALVPVLAASPAAATTETAAGVTWLAAQQEADGGFETVGFPGFETPDAVLALAMQGQADGSWSKAEARVAVATVATPGTRTPLDALDDWADSPGFGVIQAAKVIALVAGPLGLDPTRFDWGCDGGRGENLVALLGDPDGDGKFAADGVFNGTLYAAIAKRWVAGTVPASTVTYIRSKQKSDGSWSYDGDATGTGGDVDTTALALRALAAAGVTTGDADYDAAVTFLEAAQQVNGAWPSAFTADDTNSTAVAVLALAPTGDGNVALAETWLESQQVQAPAADAGRFVSPNDGWGINTSATSQAVQALLRPTIGYPAADVAPDCGVGRYTASILYQGLPHVFYDGDGVLVHQWWTGNQWGSEVLDGAGASPARPGQTANAVGEHVSTMLYGGAPHVFYFDRTAGGLRHAWYVSGSGWYFEQLDGAGASPVRPGQSTDRVGAWTSVTSYQGQPQVFYADLTEGTLRHGWYMPGPGWYFETLDGLGGATGQTTGDVGSHTAAFSYGGWPHVVYRDETSGNLRHGFYSVFGWLFETFDGSGGSNGRVDDDVGAWMSWVTFFGQPHLFYENLGARTLRHAWYVPGSSWHFETLDGLGGGGGRTDDLVGRFSAPRLYEGLPHVWYLDDQTGRQRHAWWTGFRWYYEDLDGAGVVASTGRGGPQAGSFQTALLYGGAPHVWYRSTGTSPGAFRHAWWTGTKWLYETRDTP